MHHKIIMNLHQEPLALLRFLVLCQVWFTAHGRTAYIAYARLFRFLLVIFLEIRFVVRFSVVVSVVLLSPFSISSLLNRQTCFIIFFRRRRHVAVSQFFASKTIPNKVKGFIRHQNFNSVASKVTRHIVYIVIVIYLNICLNTSCPTGALCKVSLRHLI